MELQREIYTDIDIFNLHKKDILTIPPFPPTSPHAGGIEMVTGILGVWPKRNNLVWFQEDIFAVHSHICVWLGYCLPPSVGMASRALL